MRKNICIDLGTANVLVSVNGELIFEEPTYIAMSNDKRTVLSVGKEAKSMSGKVSKEISVVRPMKNGVISDFKAARKLVEYCISLAGKNNWLKPNVLISVPAGLTSVEERAVIEAGIYAGASKVVLLPEPISAAIGAGLPVLSAKGFMIVNMGGGTSEIAVVSVGSVINFKSERIAGDFITEKIMTFLKQQYEINVGEASAEELKIQIGNLVPTAEPIFHEIRGKDLDGFTPRTLNISSNDIIDAISPVISVIARSVKEVIEKSQSELVSDIIENGIVLSGGTAGIKGIDIFMHDSVGIYAHIAEDPIHAVIRGLSASVEKIFS